MIKKMEPIIYVINEVSLGCRLGVKSDLIIILIAKTNTMI